MVYTDRVHLTADSLNELHSFAEQIGLKRHYFEGVYKGHAHYDLVNNKILNIAIENGANVVTAKEIAVISNALSKRRVLKKR